MHLERKIRKYLNNHVLIQKRKKIMDPQPEKEAVVSIKKGKEKKSGRLCSELIQISNPNGWTCDWKRRGHSAIQFFRSFLITKQAAGHPWRVRKWSICTLIRRTRTCENKKLEVIRLGEWLFGNLIIYKGNKCKTRRGARPTVVIEWKQTSWLTNCRSIQTHVKIGRPSLNIASIHRLHTL